MENLLVQLNDLPDEILMIILKKLYNVEVLHSLIGVNKRLNRIAHDPIFTNYLTLLQSSSDDLIYPLPDPMLDRFCLEILPEIRHQVKSLYLESTSIERILVTNYPKLYDLGLCSINVEVAISLFTDKNPLAHIFKNQISSLFITLIDKKTQTSKKDVLAFIFTQILTMFTNLQCLRFNPSSSCTQDLSFYMIPPTIISSTLLELHISLTFFGDCLYLLNGRFNQLRAFHVNICVISSSHLTINKEKLPNLRFFSLYCDTYTGAYDESILPLLHRMLNLEKLDLNLVVGRNDEFIDGNTLKKDIITHMPQLNKFTFNIYSIIHRHNQINLPLNEDIQQTFGYFHDNEIISCIDHFQERKSSQCHIYSYPYKLKFYKDITNNFPGGLFKYVNEVSLYDERPFEHQFFLRIAQSFPFMKELTIINQKPRSDKQYIESKTLNSDLSIIEYPHLTHLELNQAHDDYVEQFLVDTKMSLLNNVYLAVNYQSLERVTYSFTRNTTRINCAKITFLSLRQASRIHESIKDYFPHAYIHSDYY